ncbi:hypothetical protein VQH23_12165 [Pararoseomonas sp. SCSIO 73927]|uniref:hypothetical protein n=1 Tax=Pararoseomonas sp. SCSIO 73927 TaxID=3114537 RepID=UPI0030CC7676
MDGTRCPVILIGYDCFSSILRENGFLGGRLVPVDPLKPYSSGDPQSLDTFQFVLQSFDEALGMPLPSGLSELDKAARLLVASGGRLGLLENLLTNARQEARGPRVCC